jgi:hypothetical protein
LVARLTPPVLAKEPPPNNRASAVLEKAGFTSFKDCFLPRRSSTSKKIEFRAPERARAAEPLVHEGEKCREFARLLRRRSGPIPKIRNYRRTSAVLY